MAKRRTVQVDAEVWARVQEFLSWWKAHRVEIDEALRRLSYVRGYLKGLRDASR